jgi:branched-chain amino acid transport system substrate-binding protein
MLLLFTRVRGAGHPWEARRLKRSVCSGGAASSTSDRATASRAVPGEGVEPSRAEAHGFLRPARLPVPPSRPSGPRVAARRRRVGLVALLLLVGASCGGETSSPASGPTIAFLFDGAPADAELVTSPALAGLELAARESGHVGIEPLNVGLDRDEVMASLQDLGEDRGVVAAVVGPWTTPPDGAIEMLAADGVPVVSLSWAWGPPEETDDLWLSFAADRAREAVLLVSGASALPPGRAPLCLAGDDHVTSRALAATAEELATAAGDPELVTAGVVTSGRTASASAVAARIGDARCPTVVWAGGATDAALVVSSIEDPPTIIGTSRMKTDDGLAIASTGVDVHTVCACADVSLSTDPISQRFVHDLQAESGAAPGPFAVEAYDAGTMLIGLLDGGGSREALAAGLDDLAGFRGLVTAYAFEGSGSRAPADPDVGAWRAAGSRWLPEPAPAP